MDYIYGILNQKVKAMNYSGVETDTAITTVDNNLGRISVTTKLNTSNVSTLIDSKINVLDYSDTEENHKVVVAVNENNGIISVARRTLDSDDISDFNSSVNNLITNIIPPAPEEDGNYTLKLSVVGGQASYTWVKD